jgi:hypothetical protein
MTREILRVRRSAWRSRLIAALSLALCASFGASVSAVPTRAATLVPAYGVITISDDGTGPTVKTSYDPLLWRCSFTVFGSPATQVDASCTPTADNGSMWDCPLMLLTTSVTGGIAGGFVDCGGSGLDTGVVSGINSVEREGNLGPVFSIFCEAYPGSLGVLVPRYTVTCDEPGLPDANLDLHQVAAAAG